MLCGTRSRDSPAENSAGPVVATRYQARPMATANRTNQKAIATTRARTALEPSLGSSRKAIARPATGIA
ncbi:MAG: hypothetical protein LKI24_08335 [Acidipropionibacterium sp.]|nr:hypothetical protein [Acidipropionibacterium sp.]